MSTLAPARHGQQLLELIRRHCGGDQDGLNLSAVDFTQHSKFLRGFRALGQQRQIRLSIQAGNAGQRLRRLLVGVLALHLRAVDLRAGTGG